MANKLRLGVNIDHVASLRQARRTYYPSVIEAADICERAGAVGITVHLREDRRHIQDADVFALRKTIRTSMNLEMANVPEIIGIALKCRPDEVCLVPEKRRELTTEGGLDIVGMKKSLAKTVARLSKAGIIVSMFIDPDIRQVEASRDIGAPYIELHTGTFCGAKGRQAASELKKLIDAAVYADDIGLKVNAGHGINLDNIGGILKMPNLDTLNIGHSIVCRSVIVGLRNAVKEMLKGMGAYKGGRA